MHSTISLRPLGPSMFLTCALAVVAPGCTEKAEPSSAPLTHEPGSTNAASAAAAWAEHYGDLGAPPTQGPGAASPHGPDGPPGSSTVHQGVVAETMNASGYTYVKISGPEGEIWAAGPETSVKVGDQVSFSGGMTMSNFHSKTLNRDFDRILFVSALSIGGSSAGGSSAMDTAPGADGSPATPPADTAEVDLAKIPKAKGGHRVAEVFAQKAALAGKEVSIRARVVKFNPSILGRNWLHIQDGTGAQGSNDLTVTTTANAGVGDLVLIRGKLALDKDFGGGYQYPLILEDASVTVEQSKR